MNGWYPRLSRDAKGLCSGNDEVWINNRFVERGYAPMWFDDKSVIWTRWLRNPYGGSLPGDGIGLRIAYAEGGPAYDYELNTGPINDKAAGAGLWAVWNPTTGITWWDGTRNSDAALPTISVDGYRAHVERWKTLDKSLMLNGAEVWRGNVTFVRVSDEGALAWTVASTSGPRSERSWVCLPRSQPRDVSLSNGEFTPQVVLTTRGWMLLAYQVGPNRLTLRPVGESRGWVVREGSTRDPDARWADTRVRVVSCNDMGGLQDDLVDLDSPTRSLVEPVIEPPPIVEPPPIEPPPVEPPPVKPPPSGAIPMYDEQFVVNRVGPTFFNLYKQAGRVFGDDPNSVVWPSRTQWDIDAGMEKEKALAKHAAECASALGLKT